jgi:hypothetical protein
MMDASGIHESFSGAGMMTAFGDLDPTSNPSLSGGRPSATSDNHPQLLASGTITHITSGSPINSTADALIKCPECDRSFDRRYKLK